MSLQSRVSPFGDLFADRARGMMMGNRGGRLHDAHRKLGVRRWSSKQWICCKLDFNGRHREVWGDGYTELFFLDEVTALAAGHRPCFECRRRDAERFAALFVGKGKRATAPAMDKVLHTERLDDRTKRLHRRPFATLPDGAMIARNGEAFAVRGRHLLRWSPSGYAEALPRPHAGEADVLTPPAMLNVLGKGYLPQWHPDAEGALIPRG